MTLFSLALKSAWSRKGSLLLATLSITISAALLLGVDTLRQEAKKSFLNTLADTDLIVGARSGPVNLLLYSVFHIGNATNNIDYQTYQTLRKMPEVKWAVPLSLGDSHRGFRVIGTLPDFYQHYRYGHDQPLVFQTGQAFSDLYDVVLGAKVAQKYGYRIGDPIVLSHGVSSGHLAPKHDDKPFQVSGILAVTGTPVDNSLQVSLDAIEAIHIDWRSGMPSPLKIPAEQARRLIGEPQTVTAVMVGLKNKLTTFKMQRRLNEFKDEPLLAILPGATLASLWQIIAPFEKALLAVASLVLVAGLVGMLITLLSTLKERRHEIAVLRAIGIHGYDVLILFALEAFFILLLGTASGLVILVGGLTALAPYLAEHYGLFIQVGWPSLQQWGYIGLAWGLGVLISLIPGIMAYRTHLTQGLSR
ncbi:MAG: ABC transporter permease [Hydrogenovibrio sp.]